MDGEDLCEVAAPVVSVLTPSLNHGRFLHETIESIIGQSYRCFEHIVIDGGSTDDTVEILKQYPHIRWVSEKDRSVVEAYRKGLAMARGQYVIQCCVSDGFLDRNWFRRCVDVLEKDDEVSLVWGFGQTMSEEGSLLNVCFQDLFADPPPQKRGFLPLWLATGLPLPEGNYCVRSDVIKRWFPDDQSDEYLRVHPHLSFMYHFFTQGYCPYFIPVVANFGRVHQDQRSQRLNAVEKPAQTRYYEAVKNYKKELFKRKTIHQFRNGRSDVIGEIGASELWSLRMRVWRHRLLRSPFLRVDPYTLGKKIKERVLTTHSMRRAEGYDGKVAS
ncbi:MAG TPA: glycosyltransferase [Nitrospira sp.]|nr:glycosyltransferase [Nitrospira sp.]